MVRFGDLTFEEIAQYARADCLAVVPTGCTEQQGPHLPVDFDTWFVERVCVEAAERALQDVSLDVLVLPAMPFGPTPEHRGFGSGFIDLPQRLHEQVVKAVLNSLADQGFRRIVIWRGCGQHVLEQVVESFNQDRQGSAHAFLPAIPYHEIWMNVGNPMTPGGHADSFATAIAMHLRPETVREDNIIDPRNDPVDWFRENQPRSGPYCALWKDILWGTKNQAFWYVDSKFRVQVDLKQGGAITDLRPYASKLTQPVGAGTEANQDASYPFIIQSRYRAGAFTHYAGEGVIKSCKVRYGSEEIDLSTCRTTGGYREEKNCRILDFKPVVVEFHDLTIKLASNYAFMENTGEIIIKRKIIESTNPKAEVEIDEYLTSCWGTTEYPEDLTGSLLSVTGNDGAQEELHYEYRCRDQHMDDVKSVDAIIPQVQTKISLIPTHKGYHGYFEEGYSFAPNIKLGVTRAVTIDQEFEVCLKVDKA